MSRSFHECGLLVVVNRETRRVIRVAIAAEVGDVMLLKGEELLSVKIGGRFVRGQQVGGVSTARRPKRQQRFAPRGVQQ